MPNVLQQIEHLAEYVSFSTFCNQLSNLSISNQWSTNITLYFHLDISIFFAKNNKDMLVETIGEKLCGHKKSKLYCISSKTFPKQIFETLKSENSKRFPGELVIFFQNPRDSRSFQEDLKFPGVSRRVATLSFFISEKK